MKVKFYLFTHSISHYKKSLSTLFLLFWASLLWGQATLPYTEDFEGTHNFTLVNGTGPSTQTNKWFVGTAVNNGGSKSLYISNDGGVKNEYSNTTSRTHAFRDISIPAGVNEVTLSFDWRAFGETNYDYLEIRIVPTTINPSAGSIIASGTVLAQLNGNNNFSNQSIILNTSAFAGRTMRLVFSWINDNNTRSNNAAAIDNLSVVYNSCSGTPTFNSNNTGKLYIESFKFIGVLNDDFLTAKTSTQSGTNGVYEDYTTTLSPIAEQVRGSVVNIEAVSNGTFISSPGIVGWGYWMAWVDWNRDGTFDDATERVYALQDYFTKSVTFGFVITNDKPLGDYRIRIATMSKQSTYPCGHSFAYGEVEDYMFRVVEDNQAKLDTSKPNLFNRCGDGDITLQVYGDANATGFNWYSAKYGGTLLHSGDVNTGSVFTTYITETTTYYVAVVDGIGKETPFRYPIIARKDPVPVVYFTPTPETICGEDDPSLLLNVWGDNREVVLFDEKFSSGLGVFNTQSEDTNVSDGSPFTGYSYVWKTVASPLEQKNPPHLAIASSVSSGYFGGNFAIMNSDGAARLGGKNIKRHLYTINTYNTMAFLPNKLYLDFDLYYFSIALLEADGYFRVEYSLDGTNWTKFKTFVLNQGNPLFWNKNALDLDALGVPRSSNIKFRFSLFSRGISSGGGYFENVATLDNVKLWGSIPVDRDYEWSGIDAGVLYDKTCTTPLGTTWARTVCVKPPIDEFEKPYWDLHASATFQGGCSAIGSTRVYNDTKIWNQPGKTDWKESDDWKPVGVPDIKKCVIARTPVELPSGTNGLARSVIVKPGGSVSVRTNSNLEVQNHVKNQAAAADFLVESDANLKQNNDDSVNEGSITVKRNALMKRLDYTYWGSPVTGQNLKAFSNGTLDNRFYVYREVDDYFDGVFAYSKSGAYDGLLMADHFPLQDKNTYNFEITKGYAVRAPNNYTSTNTIFNGTFVGVPNNGGIKNFKLKYTDAAHGNNFVANPYPSNIDFSKLYADNSTYMYNTAWFWTNVNPNPVMQGSNYPSQYLGVDYYNNYAIYNGSGGVGPTSTAPVNGSTSGPTSLIPTNIIKVGQGFVIRAKEAGKDKDLVFKNAIRSIDNSGKFFNARTANANSTSVDRYWLRLSTPLGVNNDILVAYKEGATNDYEIDYDAKMMANPPDAFYSILDDNKLVIQGRAYPLNTQDKVTLGARFYEPGNYTISILQKEGIFADSQAIYIKDKLEGKVINLQEQNYSFNVSSEGNITDRFEVVYQPESTLATNQAAIRDAVIYYEQDNIVVAAADKIIDVLMYDSSGKLILKLSPNNTKAKINTANLSKGIYLLHIKMLGKTITKKVIK